MALGISGIGQLPAQAAENHNSSRSNKGGIAAPGPGTGAGGGAAAAAENHNSSRSNKGGLAAPTAGDGAAASALANLGSKLDSVGSAGAALGSALDAYTKGTSRASATGSERVKIGRIEFKV